MEIEVKKIKKRTLLFIIGVGNTIGFLTIFSIFGIFSLMGFDTVTYNDEYYYGVLGLLLAWAIGIFFALFMTLFTWLPAILGLWLFSLKKNLIIEYHPVTVAESDLEMTTSEEAKS